MYLVKDTPRPAPKFAKRPKNIRNINESKFKTFLKTESETYYATNFLKDRIQDLICS